MNILLLGSGGRESALAWKISQSHLLSRLFIAPGNAGTNNFGTNINIDETDFQSIAKFSIENNIELIVVGPEQPLAKGIVDFFKNDSKLNNIKIIGPDKKGAMLESSKDFAKHFMQKYNIPTAEYKTFSEKNIYEGYQFLESLNPPYVLKADGLAAGKGVVITNNIEDAKNTLSQMLIENTFGEASKKVVIEQFLEGIECSVFVVCDGTNYKILPVAKDYKRVGENDTGLNTGGMGSISPVPFADKVFMQKVEKQIIKTTIEGLKNENIHYCGFIFFGLINVDSQPYVIEYNARLGDPETQSIMPLINNDLVDILLKASNQKLNEIEIDILDKATATIIMVAGGYPNEYNKGDVITGFEKIENSIIFHAGTKFEKNKYLTNGGRVLAITSEGQTLNEALNISYKNVKLINFENSNFRTDIGFEFL